MLKSGLNLIGLYIWNIFQDFEISLGIEQKQNVPYSLLTHKFSHKFCLQIILQISQPFLGQYWKVLG